MSTDTTAPGTCQRKGSATGALKVLVIDDECDLADLTGALLSAHAIANRVAYSAEEGLRIIEQDPDVNAVFSDIMMPAMTGLHLATVVHQRYPEMKVVLTSGFTALAMLAAHERSYAFIPKPYRIERVIELLAGDIGSGLPGHEPSRTNDWKKP